MKDEPVRDDLETDFNGEDGREEVVKVIQDLEQFWQLGLDNSENFFSTFNALLINSVLWLVKT